MKPSPAELEAARSRRLKDLLAPGLKVVFCGINPGLYSAATGCHFARPGNRFWPGLHAAGFTPRRLDPSEQGELLRLGCGITNLVPRTTARADELTPEELIAGGNRLVRKLRRYRPAFLAVLGMGAYRTAFGQPHAGPGPQVQIIGVTRVWLLPSPSGLNAHYQPKEFAKRLRALLAAVNAAPGPVD